MRLTPVFALQIAVATLMASGAEAAESPGMLPGSSGVTFKFITTVQTPKGSQSSSGTIVLKRTAAREVNLTIQTNDGKPPRTVPLIVGVDGSVAPDPSGSDAAAAAAADPAAKAQAQAFMSEMTVAAHVGIGAQKSGGGSSYDVPVKLTPVGTGTPVSAQLAMSGTAAQYTGSTQAQTQTQLPKGGSLNPEEIAKTIGIHAFAHQALSPAGRGLTAVAMHRKREQAEAAASGPLPDAVSLSVTADLADGKVREIRGIQTDAIEMPGKPVKIVSTWMFTKV